MPYDNIPRALWPKMDRCVSEVKKKGSKVDPYAVCYSSIVGSAAKAQLGKKGG